MWIWWYRNECQNLFWWANSRYPLVGSNRSHCFEFSGEVPRKRISAVTDNFYNSFELAKYMLTQNTYICGTLRSDYKSNAKEVMKAKPKKGDVVSRSRDGVIVSKWKDKRDVLMISNMHTHEIVQVSNSRGEKKIKLNTIRDYNEGMLVLTELIRWYLIRTAWGRQHISIKR